MRRIIKHFVLCTVSLYLVSQVVTGLSFNPKLEGLLLAGGALAITSLLAKPIINILLLPINLVTFGLFRWVASAVTLYIVTLVVPGFKILGFSFPGYSIFGFDITAANLPAGFIALIAFSFLLSFVNSFLHWLLK